MLAARLTFTIYSEISNKLYLQSRETGPTGVELPTANYGLALLYVRFDIWVYTPPSEKNKEEGIV